MPQSTHENIPGVGPQFPVDRQDVPPVSYLNADGSLRPGVQPQLADEEVARALELMSLSRAFDEKGFALQRQGRFGTFSPVRGQEASVVGAAAALDPLVDWVVPQYRELPALLHQGLPLETFMLYFMGHPLGGCIPEDVNLLPIQISLAAQLPQAVGLAWGLQLQGRSGVVLVFVGDGASSEGDFHEALNLAGVVGAPVVFLLQNNGWAMSTPRRRQSKARTFAERGPGYGMPGVLVDGNDLLAVHAVVSDAVSLARSGGGPTLVESLTYRVGAHNTADDPSRYVDAAAATEWDARDPIARVELYLRGRNLWNDERSTALRAANVEEIDRALAAARAVPVAGEAALFEHVYAAPPVRLQQQRAEWCARHHDEIPR
jgi:pyruvate dehydrogenase E1 component alpha subunit